MAVEVKFTKTEEYGAWLELFLIHIARFSLSFFGYPLMPLAILGKYVFGIKEIWLLNDTKDGDFGDFKWKLKTLRKYKRVKAKWLKNIILFILWFFRNHSWNFYRKFIPDHNAGEVHEYEKRINTTGNNVVLQWCTRAGTHGKDYTLFRVFPDGKLFFRWSKANAKKERWFGAGGSEYKMRMKPIF